MGKTFKDQRKWERRNNKASDDGLRKPRGKPRLDEPEDWEDEDDFSEYYDPDKINWDDD